MNCLQRVESAVLMMNSVDVVAIAHLDHWKQDLAGAVFPLVVPCSRGLFCYVGICTGVLDVEKEDRSVVAEENVSVELLDWLGQCFGGSRNACCE